MNIHYKLITILFSVFIISACGSKSDPQLVYEKYTACIQNMNDFNVNALVPFISSRAKNAIETKIINAEKQQLDAILTFWKAESIYPQNGNLTLSTKKNSARLKFAVKNHPDLGTTQTTNVFFIKEHGWKIDKVIIETSNGDFNFKSTTF